MRNFAFGVGLLVFGLSVAWLLNSSGYHLFSSNNGQDGIGIVAFKSNDVSVRSKNGLVWDNADVNQNLFAYDSILTLDNSKAELHLSDGTTIAMDENSLIVLMPPQEKGGPLKIDLKRGVVHVKSDHGRLVQIGDKILSLSETSVEFRASGELPPPLAAVKNDEIIAAKK